MIKKHLITCSVIFVLVVISRLAVNSSAVIKPTAIVSTLPTKFIFTKSNTADELSFANETLPVNDTKVDRKMKHSLMQHDYQYSTIKHAATKSRKLFPVIVPILKAYGIPEDFKYIRLLNRAYVPAYRQKGRQDYGSLCPVPRVPTG